MRLASFNVENIFERPLVMSLPSWEDGKTVPKDYDDLNKNLILLLLLETRTILLIVLLYVLLYVPYSVVTPVY